VSERVSRGRRVTREKQSRYCSEGHPLVRVLKVRCKQTITNIRISSPYRAVNAVSLSCDQQSVNVHRLSVGRSVAAVPVAVI